MYLCDYKFYYNCHFFDTLQVPPDMLCNEAKEKKTEYLYRANIPHGSVKCPNFLTHWGVSYNINYTELHFTGNGGEFDYVENCGQPRSELNSCFRKQPQDPAFSITLGPCPTTSLVHRQSLTQNLKCIGHFSR